MRVSFRSTPAEEGKKVSKMEQIKKGDEIKAQMTVAANAKWSQISHSG